MKIYSLNLILFAILILTACEESNVDAERFCKCYEVNWQGDCKEDMKQLKSELQKDEKRYLDFAKAALKSCPGSASLIKEMKIDTEAAAKEFCSCSEKEGDAKEKCYDEWVEKYKGAKASEEDAKKMGEEMAKCDLSGAMKVLQKAQE